MIKLLKRLFVLTLCMLTLFTLSCSNNVNSPNAGSGAPDTSIVTPPSPTLDMVSVKELLVGEKARLNLTATNVTEDILWSSSNPDVVSVDKDGNLTALTSGSSVVKAAHGTVVASCTVNVSYGNLCPVISTYSRLDVKEDVQKVISCDNQHDIGAYVKFNNVEFFDGNFSYSSSNSDVLTVDSNGIITPITVGVSTITIKAVWRHFEIYSEFSVDVRNDVTFNLNGGVLQNFIIETPASFNTVHNNKITLNPTVSINGQSPIAVSDITFTAMEGVLEEDYSYDTNTTVYTANALGSVLVELKYAYNGAEYFSSFEIKAVRPIKEINVPVEMFSSGAGTYKEKVGEEYVNKTLVDYAWGGGQDVIGVTLYDAYQDDNKLEVLGEKVLGVTLNQEGFSNACLTIGSKTECYSLYIKDACRYFISDKNDLLGALEMTAKTDYAIGHHVLLNDIDMTGTTIGNFNENAIFKGVFEGNGHVIYNATLDVISDDSIQSQGLFGNIKSGSTIQNVAFVNLSALGNHSLTGLFTTSYCEGVKLENIYVEYDVNNECDTGLFVIFRGTATNVVINRPVSSNYDLQAWCYSDDTYFGSSAFARVTSDLIDGTASLTNVNVISQKPVGYYREYDCLVDPVFDANGNVTKLNDYFTYGENETQLHYVYDFMMRDGSDNFGLGLENPTVQNTAELTKKTLVVPNLRRYSDFAQMASDDSDKYLANIENMKKSSYWVVIDNVPIWKGLLTAEKSTQNHYSLYADGEKLNGTTITLEEGNSYNLSVKIMGFDPQDVQYQVEGTKFSVTDATLTANVVGQEELKVIVIIGEDVFVKTYNLVCMPAPETVNEVVNYDASTGRLMTTKLNGETIKSVTVDGVLLTEENGGLWASNGEYYIRAKTSLSDEVSGIAYKTVGDQRVLTLLVDTGDKVYNFTNVHYYNLMVGDKEGILKAFDRSTFASDDSRKTVNDWHIALLNDVDMQGVQVSNTKTYTFGGYFDGRGYSIKNLTTKVASYDEVDGEWITNGGFLGYETNENTVIKNVAFINLNSSNYDPYQGGALSIVANGVYENLYFDLNVNIAKQGLFSKIGNATFTNVVINAPTDSEFNNASSVNYVADEELGISPFIRNITASDFNKLNNIYVISKKAVAFKKTYYVGDGNPSYIVYGENETEIFYNFSEFAGIANPTVQNTLSTGKTVVIQNIRRYDDMSKLALDTDTNHLANLEEMVASGMWKVDSGSLVWKGSQA